MARYDTFPYGGTTYGTTTTTANLWTLEIDWTGAGWDGASEADRMVDLSITRGRGYLLNSNGDGFQRVQPGRATITLDNYDRRYDPYNTDSPLYGYILPGKNVRIRVKNGTDGTLVYVFTGQIDDIQPMSGRERVRISAVDKLDNLNNILVQHATIEEAVRVDDTVEDILADAGETVFNVDQMADIIPYWWMDKVTATYAIGELEDLVLGVFFVDNEGVPTFYSRQRLNETEVGAFTSGDFLRDIVVNQPWETVRNQVEMYVNPRVEQNPATLFTLQDEVEIAAGATAEIWASYTYNSETVPALSVTLTDPSSDYKVYSGSGGTGSDVTTDCPLTFTAFAESAKIEITNNSGDDAYIYVTNIVGNPLTSPNPIYIRDEDAASIVIYDRRKVVIDSKWSQNVNDAIDRVNIMLMDFGDPRKNPILRIEARPDIQFGLDLFDRVAITIDYLDIDTSYRVGAITHEWLTDNGQAVVTTLTLEQLVTSLNVDYWTFPTNLGTTSYFA